MVYDPKRGCVRGEDDFVDVTPNSLSFEELRQTSYKRSISVFRHKEGLLDWSPAEWSNAMAGEAGEACNLTKKILRDGPESVDMEELGDEIADVVFYADLLATRMGFRLEDLIIRKFNKVSDKKGTDIKL